ncbi:helix-turn-helix domain-containing protein [Scytonema hofmannii FACHB-248]|uniref:Helix-turn-helix domain-containing protein n=1 Tax=Scytonema hofmannii FACHB-248 TaxID=1842502 RepID=A0ABR8GJ86_9CYAN|nr:MULTISPECIES: helix-turn-helix domain-containing protein [Nostocales]MBD2603450.1 helix-turn-helix domain-containing protein [Scytonema hofmannii FACHB-248]
MSLISNQDPHIQPLVITRQFDDIDTCAKAINPLNVTVNQLTPGSFVGNINFADFRGLKFIHVTSNQCVTFKGPKPPHDVTFTTILQANETQVLSHGCPIKKQDIFGFDPTREADVVSGKDSHIVLARLNLSVFQSLAEQMGYDLGQKFLKQNLIRLHPSSLRHLRAYYQQITEIFTGKTSLLIQPQMRSLIVEDFLPLLINTLGKSAQKNRHTPKIFHRYSFVKKAEEIAQSYSDRPLTLKQLCDNLGTSSSTLSYGFQDIFGVSPMSYLKIQRLNGVRRTLKNADPNTTTVMQIAEHWGFWSGGHLCRDYKEMFGELPSETLRCHKTSPKMSYA